MAPEPSAALERRAANLTKIVSNSAGVERLLPDPDSDGISGTYRPFALDPADQPALVFGGFDEAEFEVRAIRKLRRDASARGPAG